MMNRAQNVASSLLLLAAFAWSSPSPVRAAEQPAYKTPDDAVAALAGALQSNDRDALGNVLGPGSEKLVRSGDPVKDREEAQRFLDAYAQRHTLVPEGQDRMIVHVGVNDWPLPIPLVRHDGEWTFDSWAGAQEIVDRRIGRNEVAAIRFAFAYVDAQHAYFALFEQITGKGRYVMRLASTEGNYDGLYWPPAPAFQKARWARSSKARSRKATRARSRRASRSLSGLLLSRVNCAGGDRTWGRQKLPAGRCDGRRLRTDRVARDS